MIIVCVVLKKCLSIHEWYAIFFYPFPFLLLVWLCLRKKKKLLT